VIAVVLVGGEGTRLRPLTLDRPKPMLPIAGRPFLVHFLDRLAAAGVERVILSCGYLPDAIREVVGDGLPGGPPVEYAVETEPLGTAGAIRFAAHGRVDEPFLALNGDVLADADLAAVAAGHRAAGATATIVLTPKQDPRRWGVVLTDGDGAVTAFLEKPEPSPELGDPPYWINAGAYVLDPSVLDLIPPGRAVSIEREVFPKLVGHGLRAVRDHGYFNDIGTPASYLRANHDVLDGTARTTIHGEAGLVTIAADADVDPAARLVAPVLVGPGASVGPQASIGPYVVVGAGARVAHRARVVRGVVHEHADVGAGAHVEDAVVGTRARVAASTAVADRIVAPDEHVVSDQPDEPAA
jgi:mannose-1-phosphate guanylyltransferase